MAEIVITTEEAGITWKVDGADGITTMAILSDCLCDMYQEYFKDPLRPVFKTQDARVCIELANEKLSIAFRPEEDAAGAKALTAAALVALCEKGDVNPFEVMFGAIMRDTVEVNPDVLTLEEING